MHAHAHAHTHAHKTKMANRISYSLSTKCSFACVCVWVVIGKVVLAQYKSIFVTKAKLQSDRCQKNRLSFGHRGPQGNGAAQSERLRQQRCHCTTTEWTEYHAERGPIVWLIAVCGVAETRFSALSRCSFAYPIYGVCFFVSMHLLVVFFFSCFSLVCVCVLSVLCVLVR